MNRSLHHRVVVVTGASSGNGRAIAHALAEEGARLVLAARRESVLREVVRECNALGGEAIVCVTDVTDPASVGRLVASSLDRFGKIDVWINCAAVLSFGRFDETPLPILRRVIDTNLLGYVHGCHAAIRQFRAQGHGTLINVASLLAVVAQPYAGAYVATKFAIRGLSECLRQELAHEPRIHVCTVLPAAMDTPIYHRAANFLGRAVRPIWPLYPARRVAKAALALALRPRREAYAGSIGPLVSLQRKLAPAFSEHLVRRGIDLMQIRRAAAAPTTGNLYDPVYDKWKISGGWKASRARLASPLAVLLAFSFGLMLARGRLRRRSIDRSSP